MCTAVFRNLTFFKIEPCRNVATSYLAAANAVSNSLGHARLFQRATISGIVMVFVHGGRILQNRVYGGISKSDAF